jgi:hypothetical protein
MALKPPEPSAAPAPPLAAPADGAGLQAVIDRLADAIARRQARIIDPNAVYTKAELTRLLTLRPNSIGREVREHGLKACKRCGRLFFLGSDVLAWLSAGVVRPRHQALTLSANGQE